MLLLNAATRTWLWLAAACYCSLLPSPADAACCLLRAAARQAGVERGTRVRYSYSRAAAAAHAQLLTIPVLYIPYDVRVLYGSPRGRVPYTSRYRTRVQYSYLLTGTRTRTVCCF